MSTESDLERARRRSEKASHLTMSFAPEVIVPSPVHYAQAKMMQQMLAGLKEQVVESSSHASL